MKISLSRGQGPRIRDRRRLLTLLARLAEWSGATRALEPAGSAVVLHIVWVAPRTMARLNRRFLGHAGPTDVMAFRFASAPAAGGAEGRVAGEIYVCPAVAARAAPRYGTDAGEELVLYMLHGCLHLAGEEDGDPAARRRMRRRERQIMRRVRQSFDLAMLFVPPTCTPGSGPCSRKRAGP